MKKIFFILIALLVFSGCERSSGISTGKINISGKEVNVEIADTPEARKRGLSGKDRLCPDCGMIFLFKEKDNHSFWMKDMKFSIDIIWIDGEEIVYMVKKADRPSGLHIPSYFPEKKADKVLEVNAGFADENNLKIGDKVDIKIN